MQVKVTSHKNSDTANNSPLGATKEGTKSARWFITRNTATEREAHEAVLAAAINVMELSQNPENLEVHEVLLHQILENLGSKFQDWKRTSTGGQSSHV